MQIPPQRIEQAKAAAECWAPRCTTKFPFAGGTRPMADDLAELVLNRTWRPQLAVTGMDGLPRRTNAGNVLLPFSPPSSACACRRRWTPRRRAGGQEALEADPPYGARSSSTSKDGRRGWNAPPLAPWLERAVAQASQDAFGPPAAYMGEGGRIPFMGMLGEKFPQAQFVITGVLGPHSNAHGPNEFLHIPTGKKVTEAVARMSSPITPGQAASCELSIGCPSGAGRGS